MAGFTAINARASEASAPKVGTSSEVHETSPRRKTTKRRRPAPKDVDQTALDNKTRKPISGKGKKRTSNHGDEPESKRRKSGSIKSSMPTTKTSVSSTTTVGLEEATGTKNPSSSSTEAGSVSLTSMAKLNGFRYASGQTSGSGGIVQHPTQCASYAPETSMSSLNRSLPQTTMQAVRNSSKGSSLLYSSSATLPSTAQRVGFTQPSVGSTATLGFSSDSIIALEPSPGQVPTPVVSDAPKEGDERILRRTHPQALQSDFGDYDFIDEDEDEMIELVKRAEASARSGKSPPSRARKLNIRDTHENDDYGGALLSEEERKILDAIKIKIPQDVRRPIVRIKFPAPIMDRTSLLGVSSTSALRTCFRVGEALNAGCQAVRNNRNLVLELYARITSSWREPKPSRKQHFIINDLYHDKPPFINGTFELWGQSALWEQDSRPFLSAGARGILCRMIAKMKRDGAKWRLEILSIWQADLEDVEHVASIYAKPTTDNDP